jgi:hypothetical protein
MAGTITIWEDVNFGGQSDTFTASTGDLQGWEHRSASSIRIQGFADTDWNAFLETVNFQGDDVLYMQGNGELANLVGVRRPHGNNQWNDRISQILFNVGAPPNHGENNTVLYHGTRKYDVGNDEEDELDSTNPNWGV